MDEPSLQSNVTENRTKKIVKVSAIGITVNTLLAAVKIIIGTVIGAVAVITDGYNNFVDALSSIVTIVGAKFAVKMPDKKHPYGYGQIEYVSSLLIGVLIFYTAVTTFMDSIDKVINPKAADYDAAVIIIIAMTIGVKIAISFYFKKSGKKIGSDSLWASGVDAFTDAAVSSSILVAGAVEIFTGISVDGWLGMFISVMIAKSAIDVLKISISKMIGERVPANFTKQLEMTILEYPQVLGVYDIILNRYGAELTVGSIHIEVADSLKAKEIDKLCRQITSDIYHKYAIILTIGIYAYDKTSTQSEEMHSAIHKIAKEFPYILQIHGFYTDLQDKNATFDMVIDFTCKNKQKLIDDFTERLKAIYPDFDFKIVADADFSDV